MFRAPKYLEKAEFTKVNLDTPITLPGNGQAQTKTGYKFFLPNRDIVYDWFNAYFHVELQLQATVNGGLVAADTRTAPINSSFSLIKSLTIRSAGKTFYEANNVHKVICIKNLVEYSEDYVRIVAKDEFWHLVYPSLYPVIYFDLRPTKESVTGDAKKLIFHFRLTQAATADYNIFAAVLNEQEIIIQQVGNELVAV